MALPSAVLVNGACGSCWPASLLASINAFDDRLLESRKRPHVAHAVPRKLFARRLALALVALEESRHEEFLGERRQTRAPGLSVLHHLRGVVRIHDLDHRARRWRVVNDRPV